MSEKLKILQPFEPKKLNYSFRELDTMNQQNLLDFHVPIQRELKWNDNKSRNDKSLLIFSMLLNEPIGLMHCSYKNKIYQFLDGKQRCNAVFTFMHNEFALKYLPLYQDQFSKEIIDLNGKRFEDLPENLQEKITSYKPEIYFYENINDAQQAYVFKSINNGVPLTNAEKARVEIKDQDTIVKLTQHPLIPLALTKKQRKNRDDEAIIKNIWGVLNVPNVSFLNKIFTPIIQDVVIKEEQQEEITNVLDRLYECYNVLNKKISKEKDKKVKAKKKRFLKKVFKKAHIPTMSKVMLKSVNDGISAQQLSEWILHFFNTDKGSSISEEYNKASVGGSASATAVKTRMFEVMKDYEKFINGVEIAPESVQEPLEDKSNVDTTSTTKEPEKAPEAEKQQEVAQITFNEEQAIQNEKVYAEKQSKNSHHKK